MAESRSRERWNHTSSILALLANCHRDPKKGRRLKPADFHPYQQANARRGPLPKAEFNVLKQVFVDRRPLATG
jgi:hypothetical protein